mmetsp:Transcript_94040/g.255302  ORF Transcript_94040/g.255302 Transcript_94040/m.255302 type:complete len:208 (+) Transcript_94040:1-624(+)
MGGDFGPGRAGLLAAGHGRDACGRAARDEGGMEIRARAAERHSALRPRQDGRLAAGAAPPRRSRVAPARGRPQRLGRAAGLRGRQAVDVLFQPPHAGPRVPPAARGPHHRAGPVGGAPSPPGAPAVRAREVAGGALPPGRSPRAASGFVQRPAPERPGGERAETLRREGHRAAPARAWRQDVRGALGLRQATTRGRHRGAERAEGEP